MQTVNIINSNLYLLGLKVPSIRLRNIILKENYFCCQKGPAEQYIENKQKDKENA